MYKSTLAIKIPPKEFSENSDIYTKGKDNLTHFYQGG